MSNIGIPLHSHSERSFLDGFASIEAIAKRTSEIGAGAFALTDHGEVNGHLEGQRMAEKYGLKFIPGIEGYIVDSVAKTREAKSRVNSHLCIFAENQEGLKNLWSLSSKAYTEGLYYKPLIDWEMAAPFAKGLIISDGCMLTNLSKAILADDMDTAYNWVGQFIEVFGRDNFYSELHTWQFINPTTEEQLRLNRDMTKINQGKVEIAKRFKIPLIVVNDSHYANECDWANHGLVWEFSTQNNGDKTDRGQCAAWIMDDSEMYYWMERHGIGHSVVEEALHNTAEIAQRCTAKIESRLHLPSLTGSSDGDLKLFIDRIELGFQKKVVEKGLDQEKYMDRVEEEVNLILDKEFHGYFNIVSDYVGHAKTEKKMLVGAGRGSGGGSVVNWLMGITNVDAIKYDLLFARFLNPARVDMPDIDVDFPQSRRKEMTEEYLPERYGADSVCLIGTLSRSQPKGISNDLCRAMQIPFGDSKAISAIIEKAYLPQGVDAHEAWELIKKQMLTPEYEVYKDVPSVKQQPLDQWKTKYPKLFQKIDEMVGLVRQSSTHAAGVLISDTPLLGEIPMRIKGSSGAMPITQFENSSTKSGHADVEAMGYIKYDFLGLRTLDTLEVAFQLVKERHGLPQETASEFYENFGDPEYQDPGMWDMVASGDTLGVFQIETAGGTSAAKRMKPRSEVDMADLISVNRPGVIQAGMLDEYFDRRDGLKRVTYIHPLMQPIVERTYGIVVYQEQALKVFLQIANYTPAQAEKVRKMIGKKLVDKMNAEKPVFIQRCIENPEFIKLLPHGKRAEDVALDIWHNVEATGSYAFNEAHAVAYALIGCWTAYMKYTYPQEFITALLRTDPEKTALYIAEAKRKGFPIMPPDVNQSSRKFSLGDSASFNSTGEGIRYGVVSIRNVAEVAFKEIDAHRPFSSFDDFVEKVSKRACNLRVVESLIKIGAFDTLDPDRANLLAKLYVARKATDREIPNFTDDDVLGKIELELCGSYILAPNPMDKYYGIIKENCMLTPSEIDMMSLGNRANVGGQITSIREINTKKGDRMAFMQITWNEEVFEVVVFPRQFKGYKPFMVMDAPVICEVEKLAKGVCLQELVRLDRM